MSAATLKNVIALKDMILLRNITALWVILICALTATQSTFAEEQQSLSLLTPKQKEYRIGVLSKRGAEVARLRWDQTARYLSSNIPGNLFIIVPLTFEQVQPAVEVGDIDFLLTNSGMFVDLSHHFNLLPIATLKRKIGKQGFSQFGSVIFTRSERNGINHVKDLSGQDVVAVNQQSLGGWIAALRAMDDANFDIKHVNSLAFLDTHDAVVYAIENRIADIGIVRTDTLERMAEEKKITLSTFKVLPLEKMNSTKKIIATNQVAGFPFLRSTRLYPEWPIAKLPNTPSDISEKVASALLIMTSNSKAATAAKITGWTVPLNYQEVELAYRQLNIGNYKNISHLSLIELANRYWQLIIVLSFLVLSLFAALTYAVRLRKKFFQISKDFHNEKTHETITGLLNRESFYEQGGHALHMAFREKQERSLLAIKICGVEQITIDYGHEISENVLSTIAERLSNIYAPSTLIAKVEGYQILVLFLENYSHDTLNELILTTHSSVEKGISYSNDVYAKISVKIGISNYPLQSTIIKGLVQAAEKKMTVHPNNKKPPTTGELKAE
jgi:diguanylate cyclase (GGDEF)-like protein